MSISPLNLVSAAAWQRAVFTTYALSLSFFEAVVLDGLIRAGGREALILSDVQGIKMALVELGARRVGKDYDVEPIDVANGIFHSKICVLAADQDCHVLIGSGNLTFGGWGQNLEIVEHLHPSFAADAIEDLADFFDTLAITDRVSHGVSDELEKIADDLRSSIQGHPRNADIRVVHSLDGSISDRIISTADELGGATRIVAASPFWDNGSAIDRLCQGLGVDEVLIHSHEAGTVRGQAGTNWPAGASISLKPVHLDLINASEERPLHAKFFEVVCKRGRLVLSGSANATTPALGNNSNVETCVMRIQRDTVVSWTVEDAKAPELTLAPEESEVEDLEKIGVLRASLEGDHIIGRVFTPAMSGKISIWQVTSLGPEKLGEAVLDSDAEFMLEAPSLELRGWRGDRMILRVQGYGGKIAEGFISIAAFREVSRRAGTIASRLFALLSGSETPKDVAAIMTWFLENPEVLAEAEFRETGGGDAVDEESTEEDRLVLVEQLNPAHALSTSPSPTQHDEAPAKSWRRFMEHVHAAFRERRGPVGGTPSGRIGEDDADENETDFASLLAPKLDPQTERAFKEFDKLLELLLDDANKSRLGGTAFHLCQYLCNRLQPEQERVRSWLNKIVRALCDAGLSDRLVQDVSAAVLVDAAGSHVLHRPRAARQQLILLGLRSFDELPDMDGVQGYMEILPPVIPYDDLWNQIRKARTVSEQRMAYLSALNQGIDCAEDYPDLPDIAKNEWPILEQAITQPDVKDDLLLVDDMVTACPQCQMGFPSSEAYKLRNIGIAKTVNCCKRIVVYKGVGLNDEST